MTDPDPCALLLGLVEALREAAPRLNGGLPYPQRTGIDDVQAGAPRPDGPARCSLPVTVRVARGVEKRYVLSAETGAGRAALAVSDGAEFEDRFRLATTPGAPPLEADVHRLFTALTADLGTPDRVLATFSLSMMPDPEAVIARATVALTPEGRFALLDFRIPSSWPGLVQTAAFALAAPLGETWEMARRDLRPALDRHAPLDTDRSFYFGAATLGAGAPPS